VVLLPVALLLAVFFRKHWWLCPSLVLAILTVAVLNDELKETFRVERPLGATASDESLPSAHAMMAAAVWFQVAVVARGRWRAVSFALPFAVALSRIYLGQHFFLDVTLGLLFGAAVAYACYGLFHPPPGRGALIAHTLAGLTLALVVVYDLVE
jgi:undecaprenyl-diphosphatase